MASLAGKMSKMAFEDKPKYIVVYLNFQDNELMEEFKKTQEFERIRKEKYDLEAKKIQAWNEKAAQNKKDINPFEFRMHEIPLSFIYQKFEEKVNAKIAEGYMPVGGKDGYSQAMILRSPEKIYPDSDDDL